MYTPAQMSRVHRSVSTVAVIAIFGGLISCAVPTSQVSQRPVALTPELDRVRAALEKYRDPVLAVHDGYFSTLGCVVIGRAGRAGEPAYQPGGMGVHFLNAGNIGPVPDVGRPQVLIYEPVRGKLQLVAAEWFIPVAVARERPTLFAQPFEGPMEGHHPFIPTELHHWDLHVWLFKANPLGVFSATNPGVTCAGHEYRSVLEPPPLVSVPPAR